MRWCWRAGGAAAIVAVGLTMTAGVAGAQAATTAPPAGGPPAATAPPGPAQTVPVGGPAGVPTTAVPSTTIPTPGTTIAGSCVTFAPVAVQFVGVVAAKGNPTVTFRVTEVRRGTVPAVRVDVDYPDDARFLQVGHRYLVTAAQEPESGRFNSKVRRPPGEELPETCTAQDLVITKNTDGSTIDTGIFAGMRGKWGRAFFLFLAPLAAVLVILTAIVLVKHLLLYGFRLPGRMREARERRPPRPPDPPAPAESPPMASRR
jgi:hypothetical protein